MGQFSFDKLKKMGEDLVGSVSGSIASKSSREILPEDLRIHVEQMDKKIEELRVMQNGFNDIVSELRAEAAALAEEVVALVKSQAGAKAAPKAEQKPAEQPEEKSEKPPQE